MKTIVVIRIGESNSFGAAAMNTLQSGYTQAFPNIQTWSGTAFSALNYATNNNQYPAQTNCFASEFSILTKIQQHYGGIIYDIKHGINASHLGTAQNPSSNWNTNTRGSYFDSAISTINSGLAYLWNVIQKRDLKVFIFWDHGINDSISHVDSMNYETNFRLLFNNIKNNFGNGIDNVYWITPLVNTSVYRQTLLISGATNTNPISISTIGPHGFSSGKYIDIIDVSGNTAANVSGRSVSVINSNIFNLTGVTGNGAYVGGGKVNDIADTALVKSAMQSVSSGSTSFNYNTESYSKGIDGIHWDAAGYEDKGSYSVNNIIIPNNL